MVREYQIPDFGINKVYFRIQKWLGGPRHSPTTHHPTQYEEEEEQTEEMSVDGISQEKLETLEERPETRAVTSALNTSILGSFAPTSPTREGEMPGLTPFDSVNNERETLIRLRDRQVTQRRRISNSLQGLSSIARRSEVTCYDSDSVTDQFQLPANPPNTQSGVKRRRALGTIEEMSAPLIEK